jgi:intracellular sulfur oxidation DsrE/DsrF family protein
MNDSNNNFSTAILVTRNGMGHADRELQHKLITTWLTMLAEDDRLPGVICFYAEGVYLVTDGSPVLEQLAGLEARGVRLIVCNTCLKHYGLTDKLRVGIVGGMHDILEAQLQAQKVISL